MKSVVITAILLTGCFGQSNPVADQLKDSTKETIHATKVLNGINKKLDKTQTSLDHSLTVIQRINVQIQIRNAIDREYQMLVGDMQRLNDQRVNEVMMPHLLNIVGLEKQLQDTRIRSEN